MSNAEIDLLLAEEQRKLVNANSSVDKMFALASIIEIKKILNASGTNYDVYVDLKNYITQTFNSLSLLPYQYDVINKNFIIDNIRTMDCKKKVSLLKFLKKEYILHGLIDYMNWCIDEIKKAECELFLKNKNYIKWLIYLSSNSVVSILIAFVLAYIFISLLLLPAILPNFALFQVIYDKYTNNYIINHFINTMSLFFKYGKEFNVIPINIMGVVVIVVIKLVVLIVFANYVLKELIRRLNI